MSKSELHFQKIEATSDRTHENFISTAHPAALFYIQPALEIPSLNCVLQQWRFFHSAPNNSTPTPPIFCKTEFTAQTFVFLCSQFHGFSTRIQAEVIYISN